MRLLYSFLYILFCNVSLFAGYVFQAAACDGTPNLVQSRSLASSPISESGAGTHGLDYYACDNSPSTNYDAIKYSGSHFSYTCADADCTWVSGNEDKYFFCPSGYSFNSDDYYCHPCVSTPPPELPYKLLKVFSNHDKCETARLDYVNQFVAMTCFEDSCGDLGNQDSTLYVLPFDSGNCQAPNQLVQLEGIDFCLSPDDPNADADGDGIPNKNDNDADGDGVIDPDKLVNTSCSGADLSNLSQGFSYWGITTEQECQALLSDNIDTVSYLTDKSSGCDDKYCYVHKVEPDCNFNPVTYKPSYDFEYVANLDESACNNKVDYIIYDANAFIYPDSANCPNIAYCFLRTSTAQDDINNSVQESPDTNDTNLDTLNATKNTNKYLKKLNDKTDDVNNNLDDLKKINSDLLTNNKDMKSTLDKLKLNSDDSLKNQLISNTHLSKIAINTKNTNEILSNVNSRLDVSNQKLQSLNTNQMATTKALNDGLFSNVNPFADVDFTDDGSNTFGTLQTQATDSLNLTYQTGIFNLSSINANIPTIGFNLMGTQFTMLDESMFSNLPMTDIRNTIMFIFALLGFITVIRTV